MSTEFKWDDKALIPASFTADFAPLLPEGTNDTKVTFFELPRTDLTNFIAEALTGSVYEMEADGVTPKKDGDGNPKKLPFQDVEGENTKKLFKFMSISTRGKKDEEFFAGLQITAGGLTALIEAWMKMNHVEEVIATSGNWMMLPTIRMMFVAANEDDALEPEAPATISPQ